MEKEIFQEIARELKAFHNAALELIKEGKLDEAKKMYENAGNLSQLTAYGEGVAMSMFSLSNLELLREDYVKALHYAALSLDYYVEDDDKKRAANLTGKISLHLVKQGIEKESKGELKEALELFHQALPFLKGKRKEAVLYEANLLRGKNHG